MADVVIVGAGPAGLAAARTLRAAGVSPTIIDEAAVPGGQIYRRPDPALEFDLTPVLGRDAQAQTVFRRAADALAARIDYRPRTTAWAVHDKTIWLESSGVVSALPYRTLVLATGATDRIVPIPDWTLPGVFTLGGAQVVLKSQGCLIGRRVVFAGASPLLYLAAKQYAAAGATVAAVLDTTPFSAKAAAARELFAAPRTLARGLADMVQVGRAGVAIRFGAKLMRFEGTRGVEAVVYFDSRDREQRITCDAVGYGFGLKPESQLAELAGARFRYDETFRQWLPSTDPDGRAGDDLYLAGDGCTIGGAAAAAVSGALAGAAVLEDLRRPHAVDVSRLRRRLERLRRFQRGLAKAFAWPANQFANIADDVVVCRCEGVRAGNLRTATMAPLGPVDINRVKAITRVGMGRCQGRFCGLAAAEIVAATTKQPLQAIGRLRGQAPVKPLPAGAREAVT